MTNREKYSKEILDIACSGDKLAMRKADKRLTGCNKLECNGCCFSGTGRCSEVIQNGQNLSISRAQLLAKRIERFWSILTVKLSISQEMAPGSCTHTVRSRAKNAELGCHKRANFSI